eukprot:8352613-Pyramimonas_sp.AAC.1
MARPLEFPHQEDEDAEDRWSERHWSGRAHDQVSDWGSDRDVSCDRYHPIRRPRRRRDTSSSRPGDLPIASGGSWTDLKQRTYTATLHHGQAHHECGRIDH